MIEPVLLDLASSPSTVYVRKNVQKYKNADGLTVYRYDEAALTLEEYAAYQEEEAAAESLSMQLIAQNFNEVNLQNMENAIAAQEEREALGQQISNIELLILETGIGI